MSLSETNWHSYISAINPDHSKTTLKMERLQARSLEVVREEIYVRKYCILSLVSTGKSSAIM